MIKRLKYGATYILDKIDQDIIIKMSDRICGQKRKHFVDNFQVDKSLSLNTLNVEGFGAELAFCRLQGVPFDSTTIERESHFNKVDATLKNNMTVDVKWTKYRAGHLAVRIGKELKYVNMYALIIGNFPSYWFAGWATYEDTIKEENKKNLGKGFGYCLNQSQLNKELVIQH